MRKKRNNSRLMPFGAGLVCGYLLTLGIAAAGALIMWVIGADSGLSWLIAVPAAAFGSFVCGRTAGRMRRRGGLKTGFVCGLLYFIPLIILGLVFRTAGWIMLPVKLILCVGFGAAGGVAGVNSPER